MRDRIEALQGQLTIESRVGVGTSVRAELPLAPSVAG
jgi:signal transduction histidine kinase